MSKRSVAMLCPYDFETPGGVQGQVRALALALADRSWKVQLAAPGISAIEHAGIETYDLGSVVRIRSNGSTAPIGINLRKANAFAKFIETNGTDVVHLHEPLAPVAGWPLLRRHRVPTLGTFHRSGVDALSRGAGKLFGPWLRRLDRAVAVSEAAATSLRETCGIEAEVLFNGIELDGDVLLKAWPKEAPTILFLGRDEPRKGRDVLIEAAALMDPSISIWVTGGEKRTKGPQGAKIEFLGQISEEEKIRRLRAADVLCAPSLGGESFGVVLLEGLANGASVVASDIDGYRQALRDFGHLVSPNNPVALASALEDALLAGRQIPSPDLRAHLEGWSISSLADAYTERYESMLSSSPEIDAG